MDVNIDISINDEVDRAKAIDVTKSFIVQAPAGSGKTELLTRRVLKLLATVNNPEEVCAITFTRKAAAEMKSRIVQALLNIDNSQDIKSDLARAVLKQDQKHQWNLLLNPNRLNITTIDALSAKIIKKMPIMSQLGSSVNICDDPIVYYNQAIYEIFKLINNNFNLNKNNQQEDVKNWSADFSLLFKHFGGDYNRLQQFLLNMLFKRDQWLPYLANVNSDEMLELIKQGFNELSSDVINIIDNLVPLSIKSELISLLDFSGGNLIKSNDINNFNNQQLAIINYNNSDLHHWQAVAMLLLTADDKPSFRKTIDKRLGFPAKSDASTTVERDLYINAKQNILNIIADLTQQENIVDLLNNFALLRKLPNFDFSKDNWQLLVVLANILILLEAELRLIFKKNNLIDFGGIAQGALYALGTDDEPSDLSLWFDYKISHVLVDEFQDTSYSQHKLLARLTSGWSAGDGKTLFLVGDPMQSIYRFRQADVGLFLQVKQFGIGGINLEYLKLTKNFRSQQQIVNWVNTKFQNIFPKQSNILFGAINYSESQAVKDLNNDFSPKLILFNEYNNINLENIYILNKIKEIINLNQDNKISIAILVRNRTKIVDLILLLKQNNIQVNAVDIELLSDRMVIQDLLSLTKAVLDLTDKVAWYSILRAPWCGLSLSDLYYINALDPDKDIYYLLINNRDNIAELNPEIVLKISNLLFVFENIYNNLYKINFYKIIEQAWYALGGNLIYSAKEELADAQQFFNLLFELEQSNYITNLNNLILEVDKLYANNKLINNININAGSCNYTVDLLTIHKSKGLQFDYVILPYLDQSAKISEHQMLAWQQYHNQNYNGILLAPYYTEDHQQLEFYQTLRYIEQQKESFELARLFYVAVTRAKINCMFTASIAYKADCKDEFDLDKIKVSSNSILNKFLFLLKDYEYNLIADHNDLQKLFAEKNLAVSDNNNLNKPVNNFNKLRYIDGSKYNIQSILFNNNIPEKFIYLRSKARDLFSKPLENNNPSIYLLAEDSIRIIGIFVHKLFYNIANKYLDINKILTNGEILSDLINNWRNGLLNAGIGLNYINKAIDTVSLAVKNILLDKTGQWILADYSTSLAEQEFYYYKKAKLKKVIIDRLFIDNNIIWIIDYKLGDHTVETLVDYKIQLEHYCNLVGDYFSDLITKSNYIIKLGLYYPLTKDFIILR